VSRPLCILSVGRSGSSLATRVIGALGRDLGPDSAMLPADSHNARGYWEVREMNDLNDEVLAALGGSLWAPPPMPAGWERAEEMRPFVERARDLVARTYSPDRPWVFKDTRTIYTLPLWRDVIGEMDYVLCVREPAEVVASLRPLLPHMSDEDLALAWVRTNALALRRTAGCKRMILPYQDWFSEPVRTAERLAAFVGAPPDRAAAVAREFDPAMRRQRANGTHELALEVHVMRAALDALARHDVPGLEELAASLGDGYAERLDALRELGEAFAAIEAERAAAVERAAGAPEARAPDVVSRFPLGHFYSPAPDPKELAREPRRSQIWPAQPRPTIGIDWRVDEQVRLCREVFSRQRHLDFVAAAPDDPTEYFTDNDQYPPLDAWLLEAMLQHVRPRRMIEVGSGFSTLVSARVNRELLDGSMRLTCIEPYPRQFLRDGVPGVSDLRVEKVQDTPLEVFDELGDGDVLFIDTSHTVKTGGDVAWLFNEVLPRLAAGVHVHVHDIFLPGDYPQSWVLEGWGWNEIYLVQAFLAFNSAFEVTLGAYHLWQRHTDILIEAFPGFAEFAPTRGGGSIWIRRRA